MSISKIYTFIQHKTDSYKHAYRLNRIFRIVCCHLVPTGRPVVDAIGRQQYPQTVAARRESSTDHQSYHTPDFNEGDPTPVNCSIKLSNNA